MPPALISRRQSIKWACATVLAPGLSHGRDAAASTDSLDAHLALHLLNRLTWGPTPGDIERVKSMGRAAFVHEQLHPQAIPLPPELTDRLSQLSTLTQSPSELIDAFRDAAKAAKNSTPTAPAMDAKDAKTPNESPRHTLVKKIAMEAALARFDRARHSPRQLEEVLVNFWFNHFNVYSGKGLDRVLVGHYEQHAIRPHVLGRFRDMLGATAHHPAMLFYLDNWLSSAPGMQTGRRFGPLAKATGLNENYARELMELHTLGVDGGYSQSDVTELARMLTGWTIKPRQSDVNDSGFAFDARRHDQGSKTWLGRVIQAAGQAEGERALDVLSAHPATARHISTKLARHFVADDPPIPLIDQLAKRFLETDGDLRAVLSTLFASEAFLSPQVHQGKFKDPMRYVMSALRAGNASLPPPMALQGALTQLGMPLHGCPTPDGYKDVEAAWLNPDAITRRVNIATALASGKFPGSSREPLSSQVIRQSVGMLISAKTQSVLEHSDARLHAALILGSPDFMRH